MGILDVRVVQTTAPVRRVPTPADALRSDEGEAQGYASTRVVAVREEGRELVVSRFLVDSPQLRAARQATPCPPPERSTHE